MHPRTSPSLSVAPFDKVTGDLLPDIREAYIQNQLPAPVVAEVERYLAKNPVQAAVVVGRYHELAARAAAQGRTLVVPAWVQQRLLAGQSSYRAAWQRPVVRVALAAFGLLAGASVVQWVRNEPLLPAPVAAPAVRLAMSGQSWAMR